MRIWRDIPTKEYLEARLMQVTQTDKWRGPGPQTAQILKGVESYHRIRKDSLKYLGIRKMALEGIAQKIASIVRADRTQVGVKNRMQTGESIDALLDALGRRASAKAQYLGILLAYYGKNQEEVLNPGHLIDMLNLARAEDLPTLELDKTERLEKQDPLHRDWNSGWTNERTWREAVNRGDTTEPLFVWLEATEHCLDRYQAKEARTVVYFPEGSSGEPLYWLRFPGNGMVEYAPASADGTVWSLFDTSWITKKVSLKGGADNTLAYNWTKGGEVVACVHNSLRVDEGRFGHHHSSMTGGDVVRCAGMIGGVGGKINWVDSNSGHYQPKLQHLFRFVSFLNNKAVFTVDAQVFWWGSKGPTTLPLKQFLATQARAQMLAQGGDFQGANAQNRGPQRNFLGGRGDA
jgi:hypothetical protein